MSDQASQQALHRAKQDMTPAGKRAVADAEKLADSASALLRDKDVARLTQEIVNESTAAMEAADVSAPTSGKAMTAEQRKASEAGTRALRNIASLARLVTTSGEFRALLKEAYSIMREVLSTATDLDVKPKPKQKATVATTTTLGSTAGPTTRSGGYEKDFPPIVTDDTVDQAKRKAHDVIDDKIAPTAKRVVRGEQSVADAADDAAQDISQQVQSAINNAKLTEEQKQRLWKRTMALFQGLKKRPEYQSAMNDLFEVAERLRHLATETKDQVSKAAEQPSAAKQHARRAVDSLRQLLENLAGGARLQPVIDAANHVYEVASTNETSLQAWRRLRDRVRDMLDHPEQFEDAAKRREVENTVDSVRATLSHQLQEPLDNLFDEAHAFGQAIGKDKQLSEVTDDAQRMIKDLFLDSEGNAVLKPELARDMAVAIGRFISEMKTIVLPRIESYDESFDCTLDDVVIYCQNIVPEQVRLTTDTKLQALKPGSPMYTEVRLQLQNIRGEAHDVVFFYDRKSIPQVTDSGLVDFDMTHGGGMSIDMTLAISNDSSIMANTLYKVKDIKVSMGDLRLMFHDTARHDLMYSVLSPIINARAQAAIEEELQERIRTWTEMAGASVVTAGNTVAESMGMSD